MENLIMNTAVFLAGASVASFINVYVLRSLANEDYVRGRSRCPRCRHALSWWETMPLAGFLVLKGKCAHCHKKIAWRYPLTELTGGFTALIIFFENDTIYNRIIVGLFSCLLLVISLYDLDVMEVESRHLFYLGILALLYVNNDWADRLFGMSLISVPMVIINVFKKSFGEADIILAVLTGFMMGSIFAFRSFMYAVWLGASYGVCLLLREKKDLQLRIPFIPFMSLSFVLTMVF